VELSLREPVSGWVWLFLAATATTAAQLLLLRRVEIPFTGTVATGALLGLAATRRPSATREWAGLAALTLAAGLADSQPGGYGWPLSPGERPAVIVLLVAGVSLLAAAVLGRVARGLRRRRLWPAMVVAPLLILWLVLYVIDPDVGWREVRPSPLTLIAVLIVPVAAVILVVLAVNAAFAAGRRSRMAAIGLLAVLALANTTAGAATGLEVLHRRTSVPPANAFLEISTRIYPHDPSSAWRLQDQSAAPSFALDRRYPAYLATPTIAVAGPASSGEFCWCLNPWEGDLDWRGLLPAVLASLLLLGLAALTVWLFGEDDAVGGAGAPPTGDQPRTSIS